MGDSLMYSILPLEATRLGFALPLVGVLLSANRLVRLISNRWAGIAFESHGSRWPFFGSVVLGLLATVTYGVHAGFIVFLMARLAWGIAWSGLRQGGFVSTWAGSPDVRGRLTGLLLGIIRLGSAVGVVIGGVLYDRFGFTVAVAAVAGIGLLAIPVALAIPWPASHSQPVSDQTKEEISRDSPRGWRQLGESAFRLPAHRWLSLSSFFTYVLGGTIVSTTSIFLANRLSDDTMTLAFGPGVATLTGLLLGVRWLTNLVIGPFAGALSDLIGKANTLVALGALMLSALTAVALLPPSFAVLGLLFILLLDGALHVVVNATATTVATSTVRPHIFMAAFATVSDAGSALGPLIAFSALARTQLTVVYLASGGILFLSLAKFWLADRDAAAGSHRPLL